MRRILSLVVVFLVVCICLAVLIARKHQRQITQSHFKTFPLVFDVEWGGDETVCLLEQYSDSSQYRLVLTSPNRSKVLGTVAGLNAYSPDFSQILTAKQSGSDIGGHPEVYDLVKQKFITLGSDLIVTGSWYDNNTICYFTALDMVNHPDEYELVFKPVSGRNPSLFNIPNGLVPGHILCLPQGTLVFNAVYLAKGPMDYLYTFNYGHCSPIIGTYGSGKFINRPKTYQVIVAQINNSWQTSSINTLDVSTSPPTERSLIATARFADLQQITDMSFAADGNLLVITAQHHSSPDDNSIYLYDMRTDKLTEIAHGIQAKISPDGSQIVYIGSDEKTVFSCNIDGKDIRQLYSVVR